MPFALFAFSACHGVATFCASPAGSDTILHSAEASQSLAHSAQISAHSRQRCLWCGEFNSMKVGRGAADFRAGHHQAEMRGFDMLAPYFQAMCRRRAKGGLITAQALVDEILRCLLMRFISFLWNLNRPHFMSKTIIKPPPPLWATLLLAV